MIRRHRERREPRGDARRSATIADAHASAVAATTADSPAETCPENVDDTAAAAATANIAVADAAVACVDARNILFQCGPSSCGSSPLIERHNGIYTTQIFAVVSFSPMNSPSDDS